MRPRSILWFLLALALVSGPPARAEAPTALIGKDTRAVIVGVLAWQESGITAYPKANRQDRALYQRLRGLGVPAKNMVLLLDREATHARIREALTRMAKRAKEGSTLLFYYAGHGGLLKGGELGMLPFDYTSDRPVASSLRATTLTDVIAKHFRGSRVVLMADCCYSGGLARTAQALARKNYTSASLTSATASRTSTDNWTFTQTVVRGLEGSPIMDADGDGTVVLAELATEVKLAMKFHEKQRYGYSLHGLAPGTPVAKTSSKARAPALEGPFAYRDYVKAGVGAETRTGRILGKLKRHYEVELMDYSATRTVLVPPERLEAFVFERRRAGEALGVLWGGRAWRAKVVAVDGDFHKVTYDGWSAEWDEWILSDRFAALPVRETSKTPEPVPLPPEVARIKGTVGGKYAKLLRKIEVEEDVRSYGVFHDYGWSDATEWGGHEDLPPGYWVYVYPRWFIWGRQLDG